MWPITCTTQSKKQTEIFWDWAARRKPFLTKKNIQARLNFGKTHLRSPKSMWETMLWSDETEVVCVVNVWRKNNTARHQKNTIVTVKRGSIMLWGSLAGTKILLGCKRWSMVRDVHRIRLRRCVGDGEFKKWQYMLMGAQNNLIYMHLQHTVTPYTVTRPLHLYDPWEKNMPFSTKSTFLYSRPVLPNFVNMDLFRQKDKLLNACDTMEMYCIPLGEKSAVFCFLFFLFFGASI